MSSIPLKLNCLARHNPWGRCASESLVAQLLKTPHKANSEVYAELWMGAHPGASSRISLLGRELPLCQVISDAPEQMLGSYVIEKFGPSLPFLFKVLSIRTALSIQAHPDRELASELHQKDSEHYPDTNHKPEAAVALTKASLLHGFRAEAEITEMLKAVPELGELCQDVAMLPSGSIVNALYRQVMNLTPDVVKKTCSRLASRLRLKNRLIPEESWFLRLYEEYPLGDVGLFSFFILKLLELQPGEAVFLPPNTPHAYLEGNLIEAMANSDNVVRAGLTGKFRDTEVLLSLVERGGTTPISSGVKILGSESPWVSYLTPAEEFVVDRLEQIGLFDESSRSARPEIILCLSGGGRISSNDWSEHYEMGDVYFIPAAVSSYRLEHAQGTLFRVRVP